MEKLGAVLRHWLPLALVISAFVALAYVIAQQNLRMNANDPQIQMAEDAGYALADGAALESVVPAARIDIANSLAPYLVVYDESGKAIVASGFLDNQMPALPAGVFDYTRRHGEDRITWQPAPGVRSAAVIVHVTGMRPGFIMAGRSLREVEARANQMLALAGAAWAVTLAASLLLVVLLELTLHPKAITPTP